MKIYLKQGERESYRRNWHDFLCIFPRVISGYLVIGEVVQRKEVRGRIYVSNWIYRFK